MNTVQRDESHRLLLLCCPTVQLSPIPSLHLTDGLPNDTADAAGCSPKAAAAAGNGPRHTIYSRARRCSSVVHLIETCDERIECQNER